MSKLYDEVEKICNRLQGEERRKADMEINGIEAYYEGYVQGCEDMLESVAEYMSNNEDKLQEGTKEDAEEVIKNGAAAGV